MSSVPGGPTPYPPTAQDAEAERSRTPSGAVPRSTEPLRETEQPARPAPTNPSGLKLSPGSSARHAVPQDAHSGVQSAIEAGTRAEASLSALHRAIHQISSGVSDVREANERLLSELERVRGLLGSSNEQKLALSNELALIVEERNQARRALEEQRSEAARERAFLIQEQDAFIKELLEDHERVVARLINERDAALGRPGRVSPTQVTQPLNKLRADATDRAAADARATIEQLNAERSRQLELLRRLQTQRDQLQTAVDRLTIERDEARIRLAKLLPTAALDPSDARNRRTEPPPPNPGKTPPPLPSTNNVPTARPPSAGAIRSAAPEASKTSGAGAEPRPRPLSPPPAELGAAVTQPTSDPSLKRKPDPTLRALGRYSLRPSGELEAGARSKPPRR